jgi:NAD(P)-dependent dehydrogenase (short-subunit alcohol dehydrogenase family)
MRPLNRVVIVIGGAQGIGAATARQLLRLGTKVIIADVNDAALRDADNRDLGQRSNVLTRHADVCDESTLRGLLDEAVRSFGGVDVVVNCAAVLQPGPLHEASFEAIKRQFDINACGAAWVARTFLPHFAERRRGHLIQLASLGGMVAMPRSVAYCATKFAVRGLGLALALELRGTGVRVSTVCPDSTDTGMLWTEAIGAGAPVSFTSRPMQPERVAAAIVRTIRRPRTEVCVPRARGLLARLASAFPWLLATLYPLMERIGTSGRDTYIRRRGQRRNLGIITPNAPEAPWASQR